jgi:hypothetical protein
MKHTKGEKVLFWTMIFFAGLAVAKVAIQWVVFLGGY